MFSNANIKSAMNLDTPNEKRVTHHAFEQTYFTNDAIIGNNNYTFQFPETWSGLPTKKKAIGFRYAKRKVNSYLRFAHERFHLRIAQRPFICA